MSSKFKAIKYKSNAKIKNCVTILFSLDSTWHPDIISGSFHLFQEILDQFNRCLKSQFCYIIYLLLIAKLDNSHVDFFANGSQKH